MARVLGKALHEVAPVEGVAPELAQVRTEQRAAVVVDERPGVVDDALPLVAHDRAAEERVLARPEAPLRQQRRRRRTCQVRKR